METFLLIHGGFCGGWYWNELNTCLQAKKYNVYMPTLTGLGERQHLLHPEINLTTHIEDIKNVIHFENLHNVILVGHSYGGLVMAGVASILPDRIKKIIYIDGLIPNDGDSLFSLVDKELIDFFTSEANEKGFGWLIPPYPINDTEFNSLDDAKYYKSRFTPQPIKTFSQVVDLNHHVLDKIPSAYIYCNQSSYLMSKMKTKAISKGWPCFDLESNHFPMITKYDQLANLLIHIIK